MMAREKDQNRVERVSGEGSKGFNPEGPYTGDGRTVRDPYDKVESVRRDADGRRQR